MIVKSILVIVNSMIFFLLGGLHFYWVFGGKRFLESAVPAPFVDRFKNLSTKKIYNFVTALVGIGLWAFGVMTFLNFPTLAEFEYATTLKLAMRVVAVLFLVRTIGEFKYVGLFKSEKEGKFANADSKIYVPLCFYLGVSLLLITIS